MRHRSIRERHASLVLALVGAVAITGTANAQDINKDVQTLASEVSDDFASLQPYVHPYDGTIKDAKANCNSIKILVYCDDKDWVWDIPTNKLLFDNYWSKFECRDVVNCIKITQPKDPDYIERRAILEVDIPRDDILRRVVSHLTILQKLCAKAD